MNIEEQTAKIFDTPEKWEAYLDLVSHKERIIQMWNNRLSEKIKQHYSNEDSQEWGFHVEDNNDFRWYLKEFGYNSLLLCFEISKNYQFSLWNAPIEFNNELIYKKIREPKYEFLIEILKNYYPNPSDNYKTYENGNFSFMTENDGNFNSQNTLAWYAGNELDKFFNQIVEKVDCFRRPIIMELLREINNECKILK